LTSPLFTFARLQFTSSLGPEPGRYPVATADGHGATDTLLITLVGAPAARARRGRRGHADEQSREVSLLQVTWVQTSAPLVDPDAGRRLMRAERWREEIVQQALTTINQAIRAYAIAATDPFAREVSRFDPREVRVGFGTGEELDADAWTEAVTVPPPAAARIGRTDRLTPMAAMARSLAGTVTPLDGELHLLRSLLDCKQGRLESARRELELGSELIARDAPELEPRIEQAATVAEIEQHARELLGAVAELRARS